MTDKRHINIILLILFVLMCIICYRTEDSVYGGLAYIIAVWLLVRVGKYLLNRLGKLEEEENKKPL